MEGLAQTLGAVGEELAFHYLISKGYKVLLRNYVCALGEVDLIAKEGGSLVFIEVKTRSTVALGTPAEAVTFRKRHQIVKTASYYLNRFGIRDRACRFDVVSVLLPPGGEPSIEVIQDAFGERG
ncbi:MAG TPA: YraN family protein [Candidatus Eisenbacteria bacterium]|jgi:putative endonuclease|nr:YraN family protein [Candidatus Eisenbacteria bacterium]